MPIRTAGSAVGGGEDEAGGVGAEQRHASLARVAAERGADERGDRVALEHDEAQQAAAPEDGHRELYSIGALPSVLHVLDLTLGKGFLFIYFSLFMEGHVARCLPSAVICRVFLPY